MTSKEDLKIQKIKLALKVKAIVLEAARSWLNKQGFVEVQGPILMPATGKRPQSFQVDYFNKKAFLSGGLAPYSDAFVEMFGKVYTIAPTFRAEPLRDKRHLTEFWRIEVAASNLDLNEIIRAEEELIADICQVLCKEATNELSLLRGSISNLKQIRTPFPKITYDKAVERLQQAGCKINWGEPINSEIENKLSMMFDIPFFVSEFPVSGETFFHKSHPKKPELSLSADLLAPEGYGEIASGGETITDKKELQRKLREMKIENADRRWYLNLKRFSSKPQSGFAIGIERTIQWLCRLKNVKEATMFPRTYDLINQ